MGTKGGKGGGKSLICKLDYFKQIMTLCQCAYNNTLLTFCGVGILNLKF